MGLAEALLLYIFKFLGVRSAIVLCPLQSDAIACAAYCEL